MKKIILALIIAMTFTGCEQTTTEYSDVLHEKVVVITLIHSPSEHNIELTPTAYKSGKIKTSKKSSIKLGTDFNGNVGIRVSNTHQITSTTIPEKFGVVFQCQHGTFTVEGSDEKHQILYNKLVNNEKDTVDVLYKEVYQVTYEDKDGQKTEKSRVLTKFDFIDAQLIGKP